MSVYISTHVWHTSQLRGTALLLVLALADQANDEGVTWPSMASLAHKTRLSERSVQNLMAEVLDSGEVEVLREARGGHSPRVYRVVAPPAPDHPRHKPASRGAKAAPQQRARDEESAPQQDAPTRGEYSAPPEPRRGEIAAPLAADPGVQNPEARGAENDAGAQISVARGEAGCTQNVINRQLEPCTEPGSSSARADAAPLAIVHRFYESIGVDSHSLTRSLHKRELAIAGQLVEVGATPDEAERFVGWCRGGRYRPMPTDLRVYESRRAQFLAGLEPVATAPPNGQPGPDPPLPRDNTGLRRLR